MEEIIRMVMLGRESDIYLHKNDVIELILKARKKAETLDAKESLKALAESFAGGELEINGD